MFLYNDLKHNEQKKQHITDITQQNFFTKIIKGSGVTNAKSYPRDWNNYLGLKYLTLHSHRKKTKTKQQHDQRKYSFCRETLFLKKSKRSIYKGTNRPSINNCSGSGLLKNDIFPSSLAFFSLGHCFFLLSLISLGRSE